MAKDGTNRGGTRAGAGRKKKPLTETLAEGRKGITIQFPNADQLNAAEMPDVKAYLKAEQSLDISDFCAAEVYKETWEWVKARGCLTVIPPQLIEQYAMSVARWIQMEEAISKYGPVVKSKTTGNAVPIPFVSIAQSYMKQANQLWYEILQLVKDNCSTEFSGTTPQDDAMERLLRARRG